MIKNAIVIMFDSLQHNYMGCYGNDWIKTPNWDRFAREGIVFENMYVEGLPTVPCRRAMHTGRYTLPCNGWSALTMEDTTIADLCWGRPIDTALIFDCPMYRQPKFGYTRGFDKVFFTHGHENDHFYYSADPVYHFDVNDFYEQKSLDGADSPLISSSLKSETQCYLAQMQYWKSDDDRWVSRTLRKAAEYLEQVDRNKQFYLWIDSFDPHEPWNPPSVYLNFPCPYDPDYKGKDDFNPIMGSVVKTYTEPELNHIRMLYAELVTLCDKKFGDLMDVVRRLGMEENTMIMVVSDHGEPMGNGEHGHGLMRKARPWPYEELVHGVMLMRGPGLPAGLRVNSFVQSVDVAPTVCDWLGIGVHPDMQGKSLLPLVRGEVDKLYDDAIAGYHRYSWSLINHEWSYIHWLDAEDNTDDYMNNFFVAGMLKSGEYLLKMQSVFTENPDVPGSSLTADMTGANAYDEAQKSATLDGADQWTCTPGSIAEVPEGDELYNRRTDPFQLHNVIDSNPEVARAMVQRLKERISEIRAS